MSLATSTGALDATAQPLECSGTELLAVAEGLLGTDPHRAMDLAKAALNGVEAHQTVRAHLVIGTAMYQAGQLEAALPVLTEAREGLLNLDDIPSALEAGLALGRAYRDLGRFEAAAETLGGVLELARGLGDARVETDALNLQGTILCARGDYIPALKVFGEAFRLAGALDLPERRANVLSNVATLHTSLGNYPEALEHLAEAYDLCGASTGVQSQATNLISLGYVHQEMGAAVEAQAFFAQARELGQVAGTPLVEAVALNNLATISLRDGHWVDARARFEEALEITQRLGARQYEVDNLDGLGELYAALGDFVQAAGTHTMALHASRELGDGEGEIDALLNLGRDFLATAQVNLALGFLNEGLARAQALERQPAVVAAHGLLSQAYEQAGDLTRALHHHRAFHNLEKSIFNEQSDEKTRRLTAQFEVEKAQRQTEEYRRRAQELEEAQLEIVTRLAAAGEYRDDDPGEHTRRVGRNAAAIATALGWPKDEVRLLFAAARLHDVGKIGVSDTVLHKPGRLKADEMALMQLHTTIGARILSAGHSRLLKMAEEVALSHHERWDGKGYPFGLVGDAIPLSARIVAVADVLDVLTHERPYKRAWPVEEALAEIQRQSGHQFDPQVVEACGAVFGTGDNLPTDESTTWLEHTEKPQRFLTDRKRRPELPLLSTTGLKERYETLLAEKTRELAAAKQEAQATSKRLQELAFTDPLTRLGNRRAFEEDLEAEVARALRHADTLSVLALDLDMLKATNDSEGHERGDELLRAFGAAIEHNLRHLGKVYRVGGDEFMAIMIHVVPNDLPKVRSHVESAICVVRGSGFPAASVSVGLASLDEVKAVGDLVRLSDQRMYGDKVRKRNERGVNDAGDVRLRPQKLKN